MRDPALKHRPCAVLSTFLHVKPSQNRDRVLIARIEPVRLLGVLERTGIVLVEACARTSADGQEARVVRMLRESRLHGVEGLLVSTVREQQTPEVCAGCNVIRLCVDRTLIELRRLRDGAELLGNVTVLVPDLGVVGRYLQRIAKLDASLVVVLVRQIVLTALDKMHLATLGAPTPDDGGAGQRHSEAQDIQPGVGHDTDPKGVGDRENKNPT